MSFAISFNILGSLFKSAKYSAYFYNKKGNLDETGRVTHFACWFTLQIFSERLESYDDSLGVKKYGNTVKLE